MTQVEYNHRKYLRRIDFYREREKHRGQYYYERSNKLYYKQHNLDRQRLKDAAHGKFWKAIKDHYCPDGKCLACGENRQLVLDHVVPIFDGGSPEFGNIQPLCLSCNSQKARKQIDYRPDGGEFSRRIEAEYLPTR
jgi:5-methylcytosine-specific restriction endonuclease McrA